MAQGNYTEVEFLLPETAPPEGSIWLWVDDVRGRVKWVKLSHTAHDGDAVGHLIRQLKDFNLNLTRPTDIQTVPLERSKQGWVIDTRTEYPDRGYTLFGVSIDISSRAVNSEDGGSFSGDGFSFSAAGNAIWYASGSGNTLNPTLATGVTGSIPQGYFPKTTTYPRTQYFRSYGSSQWFSSYGTQTSNSGTITDSENAFNNAPSEVNNSNATNQNTAAGANVLPFYMNTLDAIIPYNEAQILDLSPTPIVTHDIAVVRFANFNNGSGISKTSTVSDLCGQDASVFAGNVGSGFSVDTANTNLLTLVSGVYRIKPGTFNTTINIAEQTRQVGTDNRVWSANSLQTSGTSPTVGTGRYMVSTNPMNSGIHGNQKAVVSIVTSNSITRVTEVDYCADVIPGFVAPFNVARNFVSGPQETDIASTSTWHCGPTPDRRSSHQVSGGWAASIGLYVADITCETNNLAPNGVGYSRRWYPIKAAFEILLPGNVNINLTTNSYVRWTSTNCLFANATSNPSTFNITTAGELTINEI